MDHEKLLEQMQNVTDAMRSPIASKHPLLDQLLQLALQALIKWLTNLYVDPHPQKKDA